MLIMMKVDPSMSDFTPIRKRRIKAYIRGSLSPYEYTTILKKEPKIYKTAAFRFREPVS